MNINLLPTAVLQWLKNQGAALLQPGKPLPPPNFESGKTYQAQVLAAIPNGRYIVQVDDQVLDMSLPRTTRQGDQLDLTYLKAQPRATFLLTPSGAERQGTGGAAPQAVRVSETAGKVAALAAWVVKQSALPTAGPQQNAVSAAPAAGPAANGSPAAAVRPNVPLPPAAAQPVSQPAVAAQANTTAQAAPSASTAAQAAPTPQAVAKPQVPLAATPAGGNVATPGNQAAGQNPGPANVAPNPGRLLPEALSTMPGANTPLPPASVPTAAAGNPLLVGARPLAPALLEQTPEQPQAWLMPLRQAVKESGMFYEANLQRWASGRQGLAEVQRQPQAGLSHEVAAARGAQVNELGGMHEDVARLAGRQLQMLEGQPFVWQGQAWPGQWLEWQVEERKGNGNGRGESDEEAPWRTQLRLHLPRLGGLLAEIDLAPHGVKLKLAAESAEALSELRGALPQLTGRLDAAGLAVLGVALEATEAPNGRGQ
ncbi:MAG: flagellar hook-length control protein FliK [Betaproteobacteria bacterium]|nr:flagellar hook-length control protein FliK [Betaproteobacteria bacterium]